MDLYFISTIILALSAVGFLVAGALYFLARSSGRSARAAGTWAGAASGLYLVAGVAGAADRAQEVESGTIVDARDDQADANDSQRVDPPADRDLDAVRPTVEVAGSVPAVANDEAGANNDEIDKDDGDNDEADEADGDEAGEEADDEADDAAASKSVRGKKPRKVTRAPSRPASDDAGTPSVSDGARVASDEPTASLSDSPKPDEAKPDEAKPDEAKPDAPKSTEALPNDRPSDAAKTDTDEPERKTPVIPKLETPSEKDLKPPT